MKRRQGDMRHSTLLANENTFGVVTPSHLGVTRGDHVSWPAMETMMVINMSTKSNPTTPSDASSLSAHLITLNQEGSLGDGVPTHNEVCLSLFHIT